MISILQTLYCTMYHKKIGVNIQATASLEEASTITDQQSAKEYLSKHVNMMGYDRDKSEKDRRLTYLNDIIDNDFLPHLGEKYKVKAYFLGYMVKICSMSF